MTLSPEHRPDSKILTYIGTAIVDAGRNPLGRVDGGVLLKARSCSPTAKVVAEFGRTLGVVSSPRTSMPPDAGGVRKARPGGSAKAEATRATLVAVARRMFVAKGYFATGTEEIVQEAGVTRGALYHHFADKKALFVAVFEAVEDDLLANAGTIVANDSFDRLRVALLGFLDASLTPEVQRVLLIDGPAVLGWQEWRELEARYGLGAIRALLAAAVAEGSLPTQPLDPLAHILLASVDEAALFIANATDPPGSRDQARAAMDALLTGLRRG
jgi:AcrR family transcriptional regulator